jgi:hypothetical protein
VQDIVVSLSDPAPLCPHVENGVVGKPVIDEFAVGPVCRHACTTHLLGATSNI